RQTLIVMSRRIEFDLKNDIFNHLQSLSTDFYRKYSTGDILARIGEDVSRVRMYLGPAIMYTASTVTMFVFVLATMLSVNVWLTLIVIIPLPILSISIYYVNTSVNKRSERVQNQLSTLSTFVQEHFSGIRIMKAFEREKSVNEQFYLHADEYKKRNLSLAKVNAFWLPVISLLIGMSTLFTVWIGGIWVVKQKITIGNIAEFVLYVSMLTWPITSLGWVTSLVQRAAASQTRINELMAIKPSIVNHYPEKQYTIQGKITFENVSFSYHQGQEVLKNITLSIPKGSSLGIMGSVGSGKTTLAHLLVRMYEPTQGRILIDDIPIQTHNLSILRQQIGYVPQDVFLFSDTIYNNIAFGKMDATQEEVLDAARKAAILKDIEHFPDGIHTLIGERGITLSGGQKQRISLARAILKNPSILILDDCLSAVDTHTESEILSHLAAVKQNKTTIIISHRVSSIKDCDYIIILKDGQIIEQGTHSTLLALGGEYAKLYEEQTSTQYSTL
ncbi:MAG: ABC transporter ATP-binding protein, partial [Bacteroidia bacterium]|nr:ABC transporter ATP-binding protein [Bacteroidia bacterium]